ncbi:hypothetical protein FOBRF1_001496 [Fusarium oxysporum]
MCSSCNAKGYFSSRCIDGRGPVIDRRPVELVEAPRPAQSYSPGHTGQEISRLPSHLVAQRPSSSRTGSSSIRSSVRPQVNVQYEPSILSVDSEQRLVDSLMSLRFEIKDMGERI